MIYLILIISWFVVGYVSDRIDRRIYKDYEGPDIEEMLVGICVGYMGLWVLIRNTQETIMNYCKIFLIVWFGSGLAAFLIGIATDWFLYKRKPNWNVIHYSTALGFMSVWILVKSTIEGIIIILVVKSEEKRKDKSV